MWIGRPLLRPTGRYRRGHRIIDGFPWSHHRPSIIKVTSLVQPIAGNQLRYQTSGKLTGNYSPQRLKEEHQVSQIHKLTTRTPHTQRIATCLYMLRRRASHADSTNTIAPDGTTAAIISCASTSRPPPRKTSTQQQQHYSTSWMKSAGPGGLRFWSLCTSHIPVAKRGRP